MSRDLIDHIVGAVRRAPLVEKPFHHLQLDGLFPADTYAGMMAGMPSVADYRAMSGRSKSARREDGTPTRVKIDLFPEFIRHLPKLTAEEEAEMQGLNPKSPDELKEEQEEKEFLNGDQSHEHTQHEHH